MVFRINVGVKLRISHKSVARVYLDSRGTFFSVKKHCIAGKVTITIDTESLFCCLQRQPTMVCMLFEIKERAPRLTLATDFSGILNLTPRNTLLGRRNKLLIYISKAVSFLV